MYYLYEVTPNGDKVLLIQSDDISVINNFERHVEDIYSVEYFDGSNYEVIE